MTLEENFISKLEAFLDTKFDDYGRRRIEGYLRDYKDELPPMVVTKQVPVIRYRNITKYIPEDQKPELTHEVMVDYANHLCNEYGITYKEFIKPPFGKSRGIVADVRRIFSRYLVANYQHRRKQIQDFFEIDHSTLASYLNTDKISPAIDTSKIHEMQKPIYR